MEILSFLQEYFLKIAALTFTEKKMNDGNWAARFWYYYYYYYYY